MAETLERPTSPLLEEVAVPISEADPAGADVSYDDDFLTLKDQVDQISSVNPEGVDYERIIESCRMILGQKSKDFRVATYLALALARTSGCRGVMEGLLVQKELSERYWDVAYPPIRRMRARQNAFQFAAERLSESLQGLKPNADDRETIEHAIEALKGLQAFTMEAMGDQAPVWSGLSRALADALRKVPKEREEKAPAEDARLSDGTPPSKRPSAPVPDAAPAAAEVQSENEALERVLGLAAFIREQSPSDPVSYRLARSVRWDGVVSEPMNQAGKTPFQDPPPHRLTYLNSLQEDKEWKTLLEVAEDAFRESPLHFLLDLQRFLVAAMNGLGETYEQAKQAIILETALLLKRVPSLPQLTFMGGAPFADAKTKFWLDETVSKVLASDSESGSAAEDPELAGQFDEAKRLATSGKLNDAIGILQDGLRHEAARRGRFLRRFYMAQICMQADKPEIARSILEKLDAEIEAHALDEWEPKLAVDVWTQLHRCYGLLPDGDGTSREHVQESAQRVFARICEVDAARALES